MSRIGRMPITLPKGVEVKIEGNTVTVSGPKGSMTETFSPEIGIKLEDGVLREYVGNYSYYQEQKEAAQQLLADTAAEPDAKERTLQKPAAIAAPKEEPMPVAMSASRRKGDAERKLPKLEERIAELEMLLKWNEQQLYLPENLEQPEEMQRLAEEREKLAAQLDDVYAQWLELQEE